MNTLQQTVTVITLTYELPRTILTPLCKDDNDNDNDDDDDDDDDDCGGKG